mgnify:CR=1 FL=1
MIDFDAVDPSVLGLPLSVWRTLNSRVVLALQRHHRPDVKLVGLVESEEVTIELRWTPVELEREKLEDIKRVTEDGAEAIALVLACNGTDWKVSRRLQSDLGEGADWLLVNVKTGDFLALEVSGTDDGDLVALFNKKMEQAVSSMISPRSASTACVVRFQEPRVMKHTDHEPR